ncbi:MAG TPA: FkbM family methyltransferase [Pseudoxanthomonas sp.]|nr:FkbM family methyltransferase [Pseudoxanthomonas sp.]
MSTLVSYAQNFEDVLLWRALQHVEQGFYIDVGANSPVVDSVSLAFYEHGWRGLNVEPSRAYLNELCDQRPRDINLHAALAAEPGLLKFYDIADTGLSTLREDVARQHAEAGFPVREDWVTVLTLDDVLASVPQADVHWMKIDVEGAEREVLQGWQSSPLRPWIVVIEGVTPDTHAPSHADWEPMLLAKGYRFAHFDGLNRYYVSELQPQLAAALAVGPNVFDKFRLSGTATSMFTSLLTFKLDEAKAQLTQALTHEQALQQVHRDQQAHWQHLQDLASQEQAAARAAWQAREAELTAVISTLQDEHRGLSESLLANERHHVHEKNALHARLIDSLSQQRGLQQERDVAKQMVNQQLHQLAQTAAEVEGLHQGHESLLQELREAAALLEHREQAVLQAQAHNQELLRSASWRVTAPLRMLTSLLRGSRRGAAQYFHESLRHLAQVPFARRLAQRWIPVDSRLHRALAARLAVAAAAAHASTAPVLLAAPGAMGCARGPLLERMHAKLRQHPHRMGTHA